MRSKASNSQTEKHLEEWRRNQSCPSRCAQGDSSNEALPEEEEATAAILIDAPKPSGQVNEEVIMRYNNPSGSPPARFVRGPKMQSSEQSSPSSVAVSPCDAPQRVAMGRSRMTTVKFGRNQRSFISGQRPSSKLLLVSALVLLCSCDYSPPSPFRKIQVRAQQSEQISSSGK